MSFGLTGKIDPGSNLAQSCNVSSPGYSAVRPLGEDFEAERPNVRVLALFMAPARPGLCWQESVGFNFQFFGDGTYRPCTNVVVAGVGEGCSAVSAGPVG